ncbi:MAG: preprotein translocase subunit SecE [Thermoleophilaceae bacterium]
MARNRQRAKQRQAERRAARLAQEKQGGGAAPRSDGEGGRPMPPKRDEPRRPKRDERPPDGGAARPDAPALAEPSPAPGVLPPTGIDPAEAEREPETPYEEDPLQRPREGQMGELTAEEEALEEQRVREDLAEAPDEIDPETIDPEAIPRTPTDEELGGQVTPKGRESGRGRTRLVNFLVAVWAELRRVQWPDRPTLITLTWVVLVFVVIMGGYLGLLDAIFSRLVQAIL